MHNLLAAVTFVLLQQQTQSVMLQAGKIEEPCLNMRVGDRLEFSFSADAPLDYSFRHYQNESSQ